MIEHHLEKIRCGRESIEDAACKLLPEWPRDDREWMEHARAYLMAVLTVACRTHRPGGEATTAEVSRLALEAEPAEILAWIDFDDPARSILESHSKVLASVRGILAQRVEYLRRSSFETREQWSRATRIANALQACDVVIDRGDAEAIGAEWVDAQDAVAAHAADFGPAIAERDSVKCGALIAAAELLSIFDRAEDPEPFDHAQQVCGYVTSIRNTVESLNEGEDTPRRFTALIHLERIRARALAAAGAPYDD